MKKIMIAGVIILSGCGSSAPIQRVGNSQSHFGAASKGLTTIMHTDTSGATQYRVFSQGNSGLVPISAERRDGMQRASEFCEQVNKVARPLSEQMSTPPYTYGNLPRVEITFICVKRDASAVSPSASHAETHGDVYIRTTELQRLLEEGVITQRDFDTEMAKILDRP